MQMKSSRRAQEASALYFERTRKRKNPPKENEVSSSPPPTPTSHRSPTPGPSLLRRSYTPELSFRLPFQPPSCFENPPESNPASSYPPTFHMNLPAFPSQYPFVSSLGPSPSLPSHPFPPQYLSPLHGPSPHYSLQSRPRPLPRSHPSSNLDAELPSESEF
ncbi:hypothetical protein GYMLUDRAFT_639734 [Collybiopsis luxurians FD-317 M1]|nr:hypothetical protein GYMLUDRAFT_639734 [Collybiopsis luxurians FD-317 M1]